MNLMHIRTLAALCVAGLLSLAAGSAEAACSLPYIFANGQTADANQVNTNLDSLRDCSNALSSHLQPTITSAGSANAQTLTYSAAAAYASGDTYTFIVGAGLTNTGPATLNINGLGAKAVQVNGAALLGGELWAGRVVSVAYDGTAFQMVGTVSETAMPSGVPGAAANGTTDDTAAIQNSLNNIPAAGGVLYLERAKKYRVANNLTIPPNVTLDCQQQPNSAGPSYNLNNLGGIRLDSTATITPSIGSRIQHCPILRYGATWPVQTPSAYAGTAITYPAGKAFDIWFTDVLMVGFSTCIDGSPANDAAHLHWIDVECDAIGGYVYPNTSDTSVVRSVRDWPWGTWQAVTPTNTRSGTAFSFPATALTTDDSIVGNILDYGHAVGVDIDMGSGGTCCSMSLGNLWLDSETIPFRMSGSNVLAQRELQINSMIVVGGGQGAAPIIMNGAGKVHVNNMQVWIVTSGPCVTLTDTQLAVDYLNFSGCAAGAVSLTDTASRVSALSGDINPGTVGSPFILYPASPAGMPADAVRMNVNLVANTVLFPNGSLLPQYAQGAVVHAVAGVAAPQSILTGSGQATTAITDAGNMGGMFMVNDNLGGVGHGGGIVFGASAEMQRFAAIKASILSGNANSIGDLDVAVRAVDSDAALTPTLHIDHTGFVQTLRVVHASQLTTCDPTLEGSSQPVDDSTTNTWGQAISGSGSNHVLAYCDGTSWTVMAK